MDYYDRSCFITLTYSNEFGPINPSLNKKHLPSFFKRLRKNTSLDIKYFASGEYGEDNGRPHCHAIILGYRPDDLVWDKKLKCYTSEYLRSIWKYGFVSVGSVTYDSCRYVCDYTFKKYTAKWNKEIYGDKEPPFQLQSQGIGLRYVEKNYKQIMDNLNITYKGEIS